MDLYNLNWKFVLVQLACGARKGEAEAEKPCWASSQPYDGRRTFQHRQAVFYQARNLWQWLRYLGWRESRTIIQGEIWLSTLLCALDLDVRWYSWDCPMLARRPHLQEAIALQVEDRHQCPEAELRSSRPGLARRICQILLWKSRQWPGETQGYTQ